MSARTLSPHAPATPTLPATAARLRAIATRDRRVDGTFVYAVRTTGIYCKPSCPSRRPLAANVLLFATGAAAAAAGFRACKRCRPQRNDVADPIVDAVAAACRALAASDPAPSLAALAAAAGYSAAHFHREFRRLTGMTPKAYGRTAGARSAQPARVADTLTYTIAATSLGSLLVAAGARGIRSIALGDEGAQLVVDLARAHPAGTLVRDDAALGHAVTAIVAFVDTPGSGLTLPLDVRGTAFQLRVWAALQALPAGTTTSYGDLAATLGMPDGARAVARACASNTLALAIPCHRVVARDGGLAGYRWGIKRKRELLARESAAHVAVRPAKAARPRR